MASLFHFLAKRPLWLLHILGSLAGILSWLFSPTYRRRLHDNAAQAQVSWRDEWRAVRETGKMILELPFLWLRPGFTPLGERAGWVGVEHIDAAHQSGKGIVFLTPHLGCFEVTAQSYAERWFGAGHPITVLYSPPRKPWVRELVESSRAKPGLATAPATLSGVRQMIRALRRGEAVGLLPDQVPPEGQGVWAPFFGKEAYTMTLAARLIEQTEATLLIIWGERLSWGRGYRIHVHPMPEDIRDEHGKVKAESAAIINRAMESLIRACPGQYLWGYPRYKSPRDIKS